MRCVLPAAHDPRGTFVLDQLRPGPDAAIRSEGKDRGGTPAVLGRDHHPALRVNREVRGTAVPNGLVAEQLQFSPGLNRKGRHRGLVPDPACGIELFAIRVDGQKTR